MLNAVESMPMAASNAIIGTHFFEETKPKIDIIVNNIRLTFENSIKQLDWIDSRMKKSTSGKLNATEIVVGAPDGISDTEKVNDFYAGLSFDETSHFDNLMHFQQWQFNKKLNTLHLVDDADWTWNPTEVNAFNFLECNKIGM